MQQTSLILSPLGIVALVWMSEASRKPFFSSKLQRHLRPTNWQDSSVSIQQTWCSERQASFAPSGKRKQRSTWPESKRSTANHNWRPKAPNLIRGKTSSRRRTPRKWGQAILAQTYRRTELFTGPATGLCRITSPRSSRTQTRCIPASLNQ